MASQIFPFDTPSNYTLSDSDKLQITLGEALLKLVDDPDNDFNEDFADDTGHTYESDKSEFSGGQNQQINKRPANAVFRASFTYNKDASWGDGDHTGTLGGNATVHDGYLDLYTGGYEEFPVDNFASMTGNTGCIRERVSFDYSGAAPDVQYLIQTSPNTISRVYLVHNDVYIQCYIFNNAGALTYNMTFGWTPTQGTIYQFDIDWNATNAYFFINGQLQDSDTGSLSMGAPSLFRLGANANQQTRFHDVIVFNTLQHSSNFTPDWTGIEEYDYLETYDLLPEMHYTGAGTLIAATDFQTSFSGSPRIAIDIGQSGEYTYWTGSAWTTGGDDYDHATSPADFLANIATLPVNGEIYGQFIIYYPNSNTQSAFANLTITLTSQIYPTDNPYLDINSRWYIDDLEAISSVETVTGSDEIRLVLKKGIQFYYISGGVLTETDGVTYAESNTVAEWETNKALFTSIKTYIGIRIFLHSADGSTTPSIDTLTVQYSFAGDTPDTVDKCIVWGTFLDELGDPMIGPIKVTLTDLVAQYKTGTMIRRKSPVQEMELDSTGYGEIELVETENMTGSQTYNFQFDNNVVRKRQVPNQATANFFDLVE